MQTYKIMANRTAADVLKNNEITLESGLTLEEARIASLEYQRQGHHVAVWIEEDETKPEPRIVRSIECDRSGQRYTVVRCDGWAV
ncbi:MAG TPA: hypothetical protein VG324_06220 [Blastocatellia bacterium]|nr:hypothetical protein [Blastocatellia bacterium]